MVDRNDTPYRSLCELLRFVVAELPKPINENDAIGRWLQRAKSLPEVTNFGFEHHLNQGRVDLLIAIARRPEQVSNVCAWLNTQTHWPVARELTCWLELWGDTQSAVGQLWLEFDDSDIATPAIFFSNLTNSPTFSDEALTVLAGLGLLNAAARKALASCVEMDGVKVTDIAIMANRKDSPVRLNSVYNERLLKSVSGAHRKHIEALEAAVPDASINVALNISNGECRLSGYEIRPKARRPASHSMSIGTVLQHACLDLRPQCVNIDNICQWASQSPTPVSAEHPSGLILEGLKHYRQGPLLQQRVLSHLKYDAQGLSNLHDSDAEVPNIKVYLGVHSVPHRVHRQATPPWIPHPREIRCSGNRRRTCR